MFLFPSGSVTKGFHPYSQLNQKRKEKSRCSDKIISDKLSAIYYPYVNEIFIASILPWV